jgi:hypothetical protein
LTAYIGFDQIGFDQPEHLNDFVEGLTMLRELGTVAGFLSIAAAVAALFTEDLD